MTHRRLDQATFQALQALIGQGTLRVSMELARAIRARREETGASADHLAQHFGVSADHVAEIEDGDCEISAATLVKLARAIDVDLVWFVEQDPSILSASRASRPFVVGPADHNASEGLELMRAFLSIKDPDARKAVLKLARQFAEDDAPED